MEDDVDEEQGDLPGRQLSPGSLYVVCPPRVTGRSARTHKLGAHKLPRPYPVRQSDPVETGKGKA